MASEALKQFPREAEILLLLCEEECAKILILVDIIRCPKRVARRVGWMMRWFYNHLARLIYAEAQNWKPINARELQEWIDLSRQSHYLEDGGYAEFFISRNLKLLFRESALYADVVVDENHDPMWHSPLTGRFSSCHSSFGLLATSFPLVEALEGFGVFTREGLKIMAEVWKEYDVEGRLRVYASGEGRLA